MFPCGIQGNHLNVHPPLSAQTRDLGDFLLHRLRALSRDVNRNGRSVWFPALLRRFRSEGAFGFTPQCRDESSKVTRKRSDENIRLDEYVDVVQKVNHGEIILHVNTLRQAPDGNLVKTYSVFRFRSKTCNRTAGLGSEDVFNSVSTSLSRMID